MSGSVLRESLADYLRVRRSLGFKLTRDGLLLDQFVAFCEQSGTTTVTNDVALAWVCAPKDASPSWLSMRLNAVRGFAAWLKAPTQPPRCPTGLAAATATDKPLPLLRHRCRRAARRCPQGPVAAVCGHLRDAHRPAGGDRDAHRRGHQRRPRRSVPDRRPAHRPRVETRQVTPSPPPPATVDVLRVYLQKRADLSPAPAEPALFVHPAGNRVVYTSACTMFHTLLGRAGITVKSPHCRPTIHGLRHTFAVNTLISWYHDSVDVQARLPVLSTWLGHADPKWTYWYLSASADLLALACGRLERETPGDQGRWDHAGLLHRAADRATTRQPQHGDRLPRRHAPAAGLRGRHHRHPARRPRLRRPRRRHHRRLPHPPRTRPRCRRGHPQRPPRRPAVPVPVRVVPAPRARRHHRPRPGHPRQAGRPATGHLPRHRRDRRPPRRPRPDNLDPAPRPRPARPRRPDRARASELAPLRRRLLHTGAGPHVRVHGKGRKERVTPSSRHTVTTLRAWLDERGNNPTTRVPGTAGRPLGRDPSAARRPSRRPDPATCPTIGAKQVGVHTLAAPAP